MELLEFKQVFDRHYDAVKNFLYYKLADADLAEDLAQEVFMKAWEQRDTIKMDTLQNLLYNIVNHLVINHFKSARKRFEFKLKDQQQTTLNPRSTLWRRTNSRLNSKQSLS